MDLVVSQSGAKFDPCGGDALHGSEVFLTGVGTWSSPALKEKVELKYSNTMNQLLTYGD